MRVGLKENKVKELKDEDEAIERISSSMNGKPFLLTRN